MDVYVCTYRDKRDMHVEHKRLDLCRAFIVRSFERGTLMLILIFSLLSTVMGVIIKNLVDSSIRSHNVSMVVAKKCNSLIRRMFPTVGTVCALAFKLMVQVVLFII